jgi:hypothetical protein
MPLNANDVEFFLNEARIKAPGASDSGIKLALFATIKEFLKDSNSWIEQQRLPVTANVNEYLITPRTGGQIIRLVGVRDGNFFGVAAAMPNVPTLTIYQRIDISSVAINPTDTSTASNHPWYVSIVKNIDLPRTREELPIAPEFVLKRYGEYIMDGVCGKLMFEQQKSYTNLPLGKYHLARYRDGIGEARNDAWNQNLLGGQRWTYPQQFATHNQRGGVSPGPWPAETW